MRRFMQGAAAGGIGAVVALSATVALAGTGIGAVFNLGAFGKGLGNGMSGGFLYQYDPSGQVAERASTDSLLVFPVTDTDRGAFHEAAARLLLEWHLEATGSALAERLLAEWRGLNASIDQIVRRDA